jgi:hypothetical protein
MTKMDSAGNDQILPITRIAAAVIVPFLVLAFFILYFYPDESGRRFAWEIQPRIQAMYIGAGYLGGGYLFIRAIFGKQWHRVAPGFLPVTAFTISMLLLTILHWSKFDLGHFPFQLWLVLYIVTPLLVPWLWLRNRHTDPGIPEPGDVSVPVPVRWIMGIFGVLLLIIAILGFISPGWLTDIWPWQLAPLAARAVSGWVALLGVGGLVIGRESRWSSWRYGLESIAIWHILVLVAAVLNAADFIGGSLANWYVVSVFLVVGAMISLYVWMEIRRRGLKSRSIQSDR